MYIDDIPHIFLPFNMERYGYSVTDKAISYKNKILF